MVNKDLRDVVDVNLLSVERSGNFISVEREMVFADGSTGTGKHMFPADTLEWRAAEYDIDPADLDTLLDMVLSEPFMDEPDQPDLLLYDAETIEAARSYHLERVGRVKAKSRKPGAKGKSAADPVRERIKGMAVVNPEAIRLKKDFVKGARDRHRKAKEDRVKSGLRALFVDPLEPEETRLANLRDQLIEHRPTTTYQEGM